MLASIDVDYRPDATVAACIQRMHGPSRLPTLLKRVDRLCRDS